ncbi:hypothetical protein [Acinetobacter colistiniresistens]|uniref:hypothetical protein n=1 Tax=Acinetobacter colistiniresistens TaxID=280145 RepID=UPI0012505536|nr:hypothetical protein [Acinetobacter colistiniresistens]
MKSGKRFEAITIMKKSNKDKCTHVWATIENGQILSISDASGKVLARPSRNTVIFNGEEYYYYVDAILKSIR